MFCWFINEVARTKVRCWQSTKIAGWDYCGTDDGDWRQSQRWSFCSFLAMHHSHSSWKSARSQTPIIAVTEANFIRCQHTAGTPFSCFPMLVVHTSHHRGLRVRHYHPNEKNNSLLLQWSMSQEWVIPLMACFCSRTSISCFIPGRGHILGKITSG